MKQPAKTHRFHNQEGFALASALGAVFLVSAIAFSSYAISNRALGNASSNRASNHAFQTAASALDYEAGRFANGTDITSQTNKTLPNGTDTYDLTVTTSGGITKISCSAGAGIAKETVSESYKSYDFSNAVYTGSGSELTNGPAFNSRSSMFIGPMYIKTQPWENINVPIEVSHDIVITSAPSMIDGPLYLNADSFRANGGVRFEARLKASYEIYGQNVSVKKGAPVIKEPVDIPEPQLTEATKAALKSKATASGTYFTDDITIGSTQIPGLTIDSAGVLTNSSSTPLTIYTEGECAIPSTITAYKGAITIYAEENALISGVLLPWNYVATAKGTGSYPESYNQGYSKYSDLPLIPYAQTNNVISIITPGSVYNDATIPANKSSKFVFCGVVFAGKNMTFSESLTGSIIVMGRLGPPNISGRGKPKKVIFSTQENMKDVAPDDVLALMSGRVPIEGSWSRTQ